MHAIAVLAPGVSCGNPPSEVADTAAGPPFAAFAALRPAPFLVVLPVRHGGG
ncbi:hypothetical protein OG711_33325 [Streptomyces uncialis]|uniref:hypothetical protein n=1 Tax=Streptomyces uncialis TaxID=1048205 RepID=UPI002E34C37A|nr:hypothetical protein [Streptomyces uncialis]